MIKKSLLAILTMAALLAVTVPASAQYDFPYALQNTYNIVPSILQQHDANMCGIWFGTGTYTEQSYCYGRQFDGQGNLVGAGAPYAPLRGYQYGYGASAPSYGRGQYGGRRYGAAGYGGRGSRRGYTQQMGYAANPYGTPQGGSTPDYPWQTGYDTPDRGAHQATQDLQRGDLVVDGLNLAATGFNIYQGIKANSKLNKILEAQQVNGYAAQMAWATQNQQRMQPQAPVQRQHSRQEEPQTWTNATNCDIVINQEGDVTIDPRTRSIRGDVVHPGDSRTVYQPTVAIAQARNLKCGMIAFVNLGGASKMFCSGLMK